MPSESSPIHISIMHDRRRAERLSRLLAWLGASPEDVRSGKDSSITIGDGTQRGPWAAMRWCICDFLHSGKPWMLLLEDDAEPTSGALVEGNGQWAMGNGQFGSGSGPLPTAPAPGTGYWPIREACAELVRGREALSMVEVIHLCCTGGDAAEVMDAWIWKHPKSPTAPLYGEPVGTVAVLMSRAAAEMVRDYWQDWDNERAFEKQFQCTPDAGDARLWEMQRALGGVVFSRRITTRSLVEHGCAGDGESLVRAELGYPPPGEAPPSPREDAGRGRGSEPIAHCPLPSSPIRRMHNPIVGVTPLEWVRSFRGESGHSSESCATQDGSGGAGLRPADQESGHRSETGATQEDGCSASQ